MKFKKGDIVTHVWGGHRGEIQSFQDDHTVSPSTVIALVRILNPNISDIRRIEVSNLVKEEE